MSQPAHVHALSIADRGNLDERRRKYLQVCEEKLGFVPNVIKSYAYDNEKLRTFVDLYNDLMLGDSKLSKLEREMVAVVVSCAVAVTVIVESPTTGDQPSSSPGPSERIRTSPRAGTGMSSTTRPLQSR